MDIYLGVKVKGGWNPSPLLHFPSKWQALGQNSGAVSGKSLPNLSHQSGDNTSAYILALLRLLNELSTTLRNMSTIVSAQDVLASTGSSPTEDAPSPKKAPPSTAGGQRSHSPQRSFQSEWTGQPHLAGSAQSPVVTEEKERWGQSPGCEPVPATAVIAHAAAAPEPRDPCTQ